MIKRSTALANCKIEIRDNGRLAVYGYIYVEDGLYIYRIISLYVIAPHDTSKPRYHGTYKDCVKALRDEMEDIRTTHNNDNAIVQVVDNYPSYLHLDTRR